MAKENPLGLTGKNIKASTLKRKKRDMEYLRGQMVVSTMEIGKTGSSTVKDFILHQPELVGRVNGLMESVFAGLMSHNLNEWLT